MNRWLTVAEGAEHSGQENPVIGRNPRERSDADLHELLTVDDVAALLKVSRSWVYEHTRARGVPKSERLPHIKVGKYVRFDARAVRAFLDKKCRTT
jgi:excisionase family DNA binding protein